MSTRRSTASESRSASFGSGTRPNEDLIGAFEKVTGTKFNPAPARPVSADEERYIDQQESKGEDKRDNPTEYRSW